MVAGRPDAGFTAGTAVAPLYAVAKIPIYVKLFTARQRQWIRTRRDGDR